MIETPRLVLRRFAAPDVDTFLAYRSDPEVARYQGWVSCTRGEAEAFVREQLSGAPFGRGAWTQLAVQLRAPRQHIGDCALRITHRDPRQAELGFTFARAHQGRGLATEAVSHVLAFAFGSLGLHRVFAIADARNAPAIALLERVGMRREGCFREAEWFKGEWVDDVVYARLAREGARKP